VDPQARQALLNSMLSPETLAALMSHLDPAADGGGDDDGAPPPPQPPPSDVGAAIARVRRQEAKAKADAELAWEKASSGPVGELQPTAPADAVAALLREGVVRLRGALPDALCDEALAAANARLEAARAADDDASTEGAGTCSGMAGFGTVLAREHRWDMYVPHEGVYAAALDAMLRGPEAVLGALLRELFAGAGEVRFHELACLVSDAGAPKQPTHPDNTFVEGQPAVLYTAFVALQDVDADMGPTVFLPRTHCGAEMHAAFNGDATKADFLRSREYRHAVLKKGDVALMDSRVLHCGGANSSGRRALLYFTLQNPRWSGDINLINGSKFDELELRLHEWGAH
jgi:ectoine hydroxylase-related dioxygenase (phytanoyl-CoA dioxygenase family)